MTINVAKNAGFCFGVNRIVERTLEEAKKGLVYTLGPVTHNKRVMAELEAAGVIVVNKAAELEGKPPGTVIIRAHGVSPEEYAKLDALNIRYLDYTCPDVKKIQRLAERAACEGRSVIICGDASHPEILGIVGHTGYTAAVIGSLDEAKALSYEAKPYTLLAQTTFRADMFDGIRSFLESLGLDLAVYNTICGHTARTQKETGEMSKTADIMLVLGDRSSSNSMKLFEIALKNQINTFFIETIEEINEKLLNLFSSSDMMIGVTAGASTSPAMIKEAVTLMSETNVNSNPNANAESNFEKMIAGVSMILRTGETVRGKVIKVANGEIFVDLGYKSDGVVQKGEYSDDTDADPAKDLKPGD
ncbi:MAG: 4-hydroxy-3-methylbut-2-enyl diphosphate reductase, partial [Clostridiales bacterium]|nr:4-hydroxy-3-methylbut-2-enyl diphosphate reductase [Clostridiales bacterium]